MSLDTLVARVESEYREMPGLSLTTHQASRLWGMQLSVCAQVLEELVLKGVLYTTSRGTYVARPFIRI